MTLPPFPTLKSELFDTQTGYLVAVQSPEASLDDLITAILTVLPLVYGDYDQVAYRTALGVQQFRSLGTGRNLTTQDAVTVACCELRFFVLQDAAVLEAVMTALYQAHPYEEPVILVTPCLRGLHIRGLDEDNPNRFWNRRDEPAVHAWLPPEHRSRAPIPNTEPR